MIFSCHVIFFLNGKNGKGKIYEKENNNIEKTKDIQFACLISKFERDLNTVMLLILANQSQNKKLWSFIPLEVASVWKLSFAFDSGCTSLQTAVSISSDKRSCLYKGYDLFIFLRTSTPKNRIIDGLAISENSKKLKRRE